MKKKKKEPRFKEVKVVQSPVSERYTRSTGLLDTKTNAVQMAGCWFYNTNDGRWKFE